MLYIQRISHKEHEEREEYKEERSGVNTDL
jgi:hypothetical protein